MNKRITIIIIAVGALAVATFFLLSRPVPSGDSVQDPTQISLQFTRPGPREKLECKLGNDGGIIQVAGTVRGIDTTRLLLLFAYPHDPGVFGWFLQVDPHGVDLKPDGTWTALGQVGNHDYPPRQGMKINLMIRAVPVKEANKLIDSRIQDKKLRNTSIKTQDLPKVQPEWIAEIKDVELDVK